MNTVYLRLKQVLEVTPADMQTSLHSLYLADKNSLNFMAADIPTNVR